MHCRMRGDCGNLACSIVIIVLLSLIESGYINGLSVPVASIEVHIRTRRAKIAAESPTLFTL